METIVSKSVRII